MKQVSIRVVKEGGYDEEGDLVFTNQPLQIMVLPKPIVEGAREYSEEQDDSVVIYEEEAVDFGYDFMTETAYNEAGHPESDILHTVDPS